MKYIYLLLFLFSFFNSENCFAQQNKQFKIQIVFHIVWHQEEEIWSRTEIESLLQHLNEGFETDNSDLFRIRKEFHSVLGYPNIRFELATKNFSGNATYGIEYVHSPIPSFSLNDIDLVKADSTYGCSSWNTKQYLNIWICNIKQEEKKAITTGYSTRPRYHLNQPNDGIVLHNDVSTIFNSIIHETGHYLGLPHPWGDIPGKGCQGDDSFSDTPITKGPSNCSSSKNSCEEIVQWENYMDYNTCGAFFTLQQVSRMQQVLTTDRQILLKTPSSNIYKTYSFIPSAGTYYIPGKGGFCAKKIQLRNQAIPISGKQPYIQLTIKKKDFLKQCSLYFEKERKYQLRFSLFNKSDSAKITFSKTVITPTEKNVMIHQFIPKSKKNQVLRIIICPEKTQVKTPVYGQIIDLNFE